MKPLLIALSLIGTAAAWAATAVAVDSGKSRITATFTQMNVGVEAEFREFSGQVQYDPAAPESASARIEIETASFDIGDEDYNAEVRKAEWLDSKAHPKASFETTAIEPLGPDRFKATGTFMLKGRSTSVSTEIVVKTEADRRVFSGRLPLSRKAFSIGDPEWDDVLEDEVLVSFNIATPAP